MVSYYETIPVGIILIVLMPTKTENKDEITTSGQGVKLSIPDTMISAVYMSEDPFTLDGKGAFIRGKMYSQREFDFMNAPPGTPRF